MRIASDHGRRMYAGCRNQRPNVSTYDVGWMMNQSTIGAAARAAAPAAVTASRCVKRRAWTNPAASRTPMIKARHAPDGCAYTHAVSAAAAIANDNRDRVSAKRTAAIKEISKGGMIQTPSTAPLLAEATYA